MTTINLLYPTTPVAPVFIHRFGDVEVHSPYPWFAPRPLINYGYTVYQVATVVTYDLDDYPGCGTRAEKAAWNERYEAAQRNADALAQTQAPGCTFLEGSVLGRTYVWTTEVDLRDQLSPTLDVGHGSGGAFVFAHTPLQRIDEATYTEMLEVLPPIKWNMRGPLVRGHLMSEFQDGKFTSAFFYRPGSKDCWHAYVDGYQSFEQIWHGIDRRLSEVEAQQRAARTFFANNGQQATGATLAQAQSGVLPWPGIYAHEVGGSIQLTDTYTFILNNKA